MKTGKTITQGLALLYVLLFLATATPNSNGQTIVEDDRFSLYDGFNDANLCIVRDPFGSPYNNTCMMLDIVPPTYPNIFSLMVTNRGFSLDCPGGDWFIAQPGQVFSPSTIAAGQFDDLRSYDPLDLLPFQFFQDTELSDFVVSPDNDLLDPDFILATQFYIAVATTTDDLRSQSEHDCFPPRDVFGWALIEVGASAYDDSIRTVELLDSAVAIDAGNIIIGQNAFASPGDFDGNGSVNGDDVDFYSGNLNQPATEDLARLDLNGDGNVTIADHNLHVTTLVVTSNGVTGALLGDINLDGVVDVLFDGFALVESLGLRVTSRVQGDLDADGMVDVLNDAFILIADLGRSN